MLRQSRGLSRTDYPMLPLYDPARHEPLAAAAWNPRRVRDAIAVICRDAESAFHADRLWPVHPEDEEPSDPADGIFRGLYCGAAGMVHALDRLAMAGLYEPSLDLAAIAGVLYEAALTSPDEPGAGASLMNGTSGILLVADHFAPSPETAETLAELIAGQVKHPANELLYGAPGTMLTARAMYARTGQECFADLWRASARELLAKSALARARPRLRHARAPPGRSPPRGDWPRPLLALHRRHRSGPARSSLPDRGHQPARDRRPGCTRESRPQLNAPGTRRIFARNALSPGSHNRQIHRH
jgi:hypothetical protein